MWYLKVSSSLLIAVALICMIQNAISLTIDPEATEDQWSTLESSTDQNDLKKISKLCKVSLNNFNEKLENTKTIANKKLPEPNKTTEDIANLVSDIKNQVKNASADLVTVRKLVQKTALRFRDTFKSLISFTELDNEPVNNELESIKKTTVNSKKPLVNRVIQSFGNRYDLNKLANKVLEISSDREKLKNNYVEKKKIAKREFNSLWNSLSNHSKTVNNNALKALDTFFEGMKILKSVKKKVKTLGKDAVNEIKVGDDIIKLKNAVELAKSLKLKFEDEWNLDSGELTYSEEQKKPNTKTTDDDQSDIQDNVEDKSNENISTNDLEPGLPTTEQELIENDKSNVIPPTQVGIEKLPIMDNRQTSDKAVSPTEETQLPIERKNKDVTKIIQPTISETEHNPIENNVSDTIDSPIEDNPSIPNTENKDKTAIVKPEVSNNKQNFIDDDDSKSDSSIKQTSFNPDIKNNKVLNTPLKDSIDNKGGKRINKITSRRKTLILPWEKLIQLNDPHVSQQSAKCENLLNNVKPDFDNINKAAKNSIQITKNYKNLQNIENDTVKQFYDKMVDTNTKLCDYLVNAADDVCAKVTQINKRYETKFKNDPNIKRIKYLLGKQYDPNQYILKVLDDANHKNGIGGIKKTTYYKMLAVAHNLNHETKEMENAALYAMNKIHEGKLAATNLRKKFNKEKASKACYIRNILLEKENEDDKKNKDENKEKVKESINEDTNTEPLKPDVNLDSVDAIQPSIVNDDNEPIINNDEDTKTLSEPNDLTNLNNQKENADKTNIEETKEKYGNNKAKRYITRKITHHRKHRNPNDPNDVSEEYDTIEEIDDEEDESNESKNNLEKTQNEIRKENPNITSRPKISEEIESLEQGGHNNLNKSGDQHEETRKGNTSVKPKVKHYRKRIDPKDGKEITEEFESSEEEDDINANKSGEKKSNEAPESELSDNGDNEHDTDTPEHLETEKVASDEENATREENNEGNNTSVKPKVKHFGKRIDPKDGKEIIEEYESEEEEDDINTNKSGEKKSNEAPESELSDNEHDTDTPEHLETEKVASDEENATREENNEGNNTSVKPKVKHYRKRINPIDGKEITEEYESSLEEDDINSNESDEKKSNEAPELELSDNADNEQDTDTPEHLETEKVASDEENATREENNEGNNTSVKPKVKHYRKRINPNDGKEIIEEYESSEEEDDINANKSGEKKSNEAPESELSDNGDNEHDTDTPEHLETEKVASDEENATREENNEGNNTSVKPKVKHFGKRIDPKDGKEIIEEYESEEEEDDINTNKSGEKKSNEAPESELSDNEHDTDTPEHLETEKVASDEENATREENNEGNNTSVKPKVKHYRKRINPIDGKEITEEYESSLEEDDINSNESDEKKSNEAPELELSDNADNEQDTDTPEHLETEKVASDEENATREENNEGNNTSVKPKVKHYRKRINPNDGKEIIEEYESSSEGDDINTNKSGEKKSNEAPESELSDNADNEQDTDTPEHLETEKVASDEENATREENETSEVENENKSNEKVDNESDEVSDPDLSNNYDDAQDEKEVEQEENEDEDNVNDNSPPSEDNVADVDPENITRETVELDEDENLNSVEGAELNGVDNDKIIPAADSMGEDSSSFESSYEEPEQSYLNDSNISHKNNNEQYNPVDQPNKISKGRRKRKDPKNGQEVSEEYDPDEEQEDESPVVSKHIDTPFGTSDEKSAEHNNTVHEPETPEYEDISENEETPENNDTPDHNQANEHEVIDENEPDRESDEAINKSNDVEQQNDGGNRPNKKMRRHRKRRDPKDGQQVSEEYNPDEEQKDESPISSKNIGTPTGEPHGESTHHESETPEYEDIYENEETPEKDDTPDQNQANKHEVIDENEPDRESDEAIDKSNDVEQQNDGGNRPNKKMRRHRKRRDPKDGQQVSEEYDPDEEQKDDSPMSSKNIGTPTGEPHGESTDHNNTDHGSETPEYEDISEYEETPENDETPDHNQANEHEVIDENEPDRESDEAIDKSNDVEQQNDGGNRPNKKMRRHRKRRDPNDDQQVLEEYDPDDVHKDESPVSSKNIDTPTGEPHGESIDHESETPEYEDIYENEETPENDDTPIHNQTNEHEVIDENEPDRESDEAIDKSNDVEQRNDGGYRPNKKMRRHRKRRDPNDDQQVLEEYDPDDVQKDESPVSSKNIDTPTGEPHGESTDHESETPEYEDIYENEETPENDETPNHNQTNKHEVIDENEPDRKSNETIDKSNDDDQQKDGGNQPNKKMRRHRKRIDPKYDQEISEEYDTVEEEEDVSPVSSINIDTPIGEPNGESIDRSMTDNEFETPEYNEVPENGETPEYNQLNTETDEHEPDRKSNETIDKSNDDDQQKDGGNVPNKKMRRHKKRNDPRYDQEISEEYDTIEEEEDVSPVSSINIDTPTGEPNGESIDRSMTDNEFETPEYNEVPENSETPEYNQLNTETDEHAPNRESDEAIDKSNDVEQQNDGGNRPNKKMRRHRKRRDPNDGQPVSEEYDPDEVQKYDFPVSSKNIDTPTGEPHGESTDHETETPEYEDIYENEETPEDDETPDYNQTNEHEVIDENAPDRKSNETIDKSNDDDQQKDGGNVPNKKMRRHRKRRDPNDGQPVSEEYDPDEVQKYDFPVSSKNIDTPTGEPHGESTDHESETPEYEDIYENEETPEKDDTPDQNQANKHEVIDENEPDRESDEAIDKSNDVEQQNDGGNRPNKKMRRHRKRRDPRYDQEISEEYDTIEEEEDVSPVSSINIDTPTGEPNGESIDRSMTDNEFETPEYNEVPENSETPEYNQLNTETDEHAPNRESDEAVDKSNDVEQQNDGGNRPNKKMRRHRKRRDPNDGQPVSEEYDPDEVQKYDFPVSSKNIDTPTGEPHGESTDHESETPEYEDIYENEETPEKDDTPDQNQANKHEVIDENEPDRESDEAIDKSNDVKQQNDGGNRPNKKMRRHRKRRDPRYDQEISEEYDTIEEEEDVSPVSSINIDTPTGEPNGESIDRSMTDNEFETPEYNEVPENSETPEYNQLNTETDEHAPNRESDEAVDKSNDVEQQNDGGNRPNKKMRRHRKRRDPNDGQPVSEEYDPDEVQKYDFPVSSKNIDTPTGEPHGESTDHETETPEYEDIYENEETPEKDDTPDYNQTNEHEVIDENAPDRKSNETIDKSNDDDQQKDGGNVPNKKMRRHRKRNDPRYDQEISEEYDTVEEEEDESPVLSKNIDTPTGEPNGESIDRSMTDNELETPEYNEVPENGETPEYNQLNTETDEHEPDRESDEAIVNNDVEQQNYGGNQPNKKIRRHRKRRYPNDGQHQVSVFKYQAIQVSGELDPNEVQNNESPVLDENYNTHPSEPEYETENESDTPENEEIPEYNQSKEHAEISELEPDRKSNEEKDISKEISEQNNAGKQPNKKIRRNRKRKDPLHSHEISEEYETIEDEDDEINKLETPNMVSNDKFNKNPITSPNNENIANDENNLVNPPIHIPKRFKNRKNPEYDHEISEEYDSFEEYDEEAELKKHTLRPENNDENRDLNNNVIPNIDNDVSEAVLNTGYDKPTVFPQTISEDNNEVEPESSEYPENAAPEGSPTINDFDKTMNVAKPLPRKVRRHRKPRKPKTLNENENEPEVVNDDNNVQEELPETVNGEITDIDDEIEQPELPENSDVTPEASSPNDVDESINIAKPRPRKVRRHRKPRKPKTVNENENEPEVVNDDNNVQEELPETVNGEITDIDDEIEQPELPENSDVTPVASSPNDVDESINVAKPRPRKVRRHRKPRQPKTVNENENEPEDPKRIPTQNNEHVNYEEDAGEKEKMANLNDADGTMNSNQPRRIKHVRRKKIPTTVDEITPNSLDTENRGIQNDEKSVENPETQPNDTGKNPKKKRRLRRIRTYMVNKATNERIPINDQTYSTTDGLPDTPKNKLEATEIEDSVDPNSNEDNDDYSSFLFKEYNSDQCKRDAYDRFKKVTSQDAKQIAYRSVLDTSEMRSNMLATIKNAIGNVKISRTLNDVDQSLRTVSYTLKTGLKQTVSDLVTKVIPLAKDFLKTAENLKELYKNGPQSTHKMLFNILENESTIPDSAKDVLKLISPQFDVDELINNIFEKPFNTKSLKEKKAKAQRKLIGLSKHMDTAISNIDCFVLSAMSAVGIGADTLKLLKSGRVIMSDKHPRAKALRDAVGIIKSGKKIRNNDVGFTPTLTPPDGFNESDEDDDDEDPDQVAQKNEEFLKTVPDLDDNIPLPKKVPNKRQSLGVIVVHPDKQIEYKEVTDTLQLKKFVGDQTKKYKLQSENKHPKFLKLNSKKLIDSMVADVKKKAERNGMSKKEMVEEIIKNLKSS